MADWKKESGVEIKNMKLLDFDIVLLKLPSRRISILVPVGKTADEKDMFDYLVYTRQKRYIGKDEKRILKNLEKDIIEWRKLSPSQKKYLNERY